MTIHYIILRLLSNDICVMKTSSYFKLITRSFYYVLSISTIDIR